MNDRCVFVSSQGFVKRASSDGTGCCVQHCDGDDTPTGSWRVSCFAPRSLLPGVSKSRVAPDTVATASSHRWQHQRTLMLGVNGCSASTFTANTTPPLDLCSEPLLLYCSIFLPPSNAAEEEGVYLIIERLVLATECKCLSHFPRPSANVSYLVTLAS